MRKNQSRFPLTGRAVLNSMPSHAGNRYPRSAACGIFVPFINFEIPRFFYRERLLTISSLIKAQIETGGLTIWNLRGYACDILTLEAALLERLTNLQFALIVIDPIDVLP
jgi:hypothetical protein